jgi:hypothetical protein
MGRIREVRKRMAWNTKARRRAKRTKHEEREGLGRHLCALRVLRRFIVDLGEGAIRQPRQGHSGAFNGPKGA